MKLRQHRGGLSDSMATVIEIAPNRACLAAAINGELAEFGISVQESAVHVDAYRRDDRIGWDTHIVTVDGYGMYGFTDGPLAENDIVGPVGATPAKQGKA